jgi:hypothetical protein
MKRLVARAADLSKALGADISRLAFGWRGPWKLHKPSLFILALLLAEVLTATDNAHANLVYDLRVNSQADIGGAPGATWIDNKHVNFTAPDQTAVVTIYAFPCASATADGMAVTHSGAYSPTGDGYKQGAGKFMLTRDAVNPTLMTGDISARAMLNGFDSGVAYLLGQLQDLNGDGDQDLGSTSTYYTSAAGNQYWTPQNGIAQYCDANWSGIPVGTLTYTSKTVGDGMATEMLQGLPYKTGTFTTWYENTKSQLNSPVRMWMGAPVNFVSTPEPTAVTLLVVGVGGLLAYACCSLTSRSGTPSGHASTRHPISSR